MTIEGIIRLVEAQLGRHGISSGDRFVEDLAVQSADMVNIIATVDETYGVFVPEEEIAHLRTVADLHTLVQGLLNNG